VLTLTRGIESILRSMKTLTATTPARTSGRAIASASAKRPSTTRTNGRAATRSELTDANPTDVGHEISVAQAARLRSWHDHASSTPWTPSMQDTTFERPQGVSVTSRPPTTVKTIAKYSASAA